MSGDVFSPTTLDLTGGVTRKIQTSVNDPRVMFDATGIVATDPGGTVLFKLDAISGTIAATGLIINGTQVAAGSITATQLADGSVITSKVADGAISTTKIGSGAVTATQIAGNTITSVQIANGTITATQIAGGTIGTAQIANGAITTALIGANQVTAATIANGTVTATQIANGTITTTQISATAAIIGTQIANGTITTTNIAANTVVAGNIAANTITGANIAANTITAGLLNVSQLSAITADLGTITAGTITGGIIQTSTADPRTALDSTGFWVTDATAVKNIAIDTNGMRLISTVGPGNLQTIRWTDTTISGNTLASIFTAKATTNRTKLTFASISPTNTNTTSALIVQSDSLSGNDTLNDVAVQVKNAAGTTTQGATIIDGTGASDFLQLATTSQLAIAHGTATLTWTASVSSAATTVTHGLPRTPVRIIVTVSRFSGTIGTGTMAASGNATSTTFQIWGWRSASSSISLNVDWIALG